MAKLNIFNPETGSVLSYEGAEPFLLSTPLLGTKPVWLTREITIPLATIVDTALFDERMQGDIIMQGIWIGPKDFRDIFGTQISFWRNAAQINFPTTNFPYLPIGAGPLELHPLNFFLKKGDQFRIVASPPVDYTGQAQHEYMILLRGWYL